MINQMYAMRRRLMGSGKVGTPIADFTAGSSIYIEESGSPVEFKVLCHDYPQNGVTMLMRNSSAGQMGWVASSSDQIRGYEFSQIDTWLNGTYLQRFGAKTQSIIQTESIDTHTAKATYPYQTEAKSISRKIFLLSATEVSGQSNNKEGTKIPYFTAISILPVKNVWTRQASAFSEGKVYQIYIENYGSSSIENRTNPNNANMQLLPCFCVLKTALIDDDNNLIV